MHALHVNWRDAEEYIPVVVFADGSLIRLEPWLHYADARRSALNELHDAIRSGTVHVTAYIEPTTRELIESANRSDAMHTPLYRYAIRIES